MSDFTKPSTVYTQAKQYLEKLLDYPLKKDLCENEELCPKCHGCGVIIVDRPYGLSDDPNRTGINLFTYSRQTIIPCPNCYNGIVKKCQYCGKIIPRQRLVCNCEKQKEIDRENQIQKEKELLNRIPELSEEEVDKLTYMYSDLYPFDDGYFSDWDDFFDEYNPDDCECRPEYVFPTIEVQFKIDAEDVLDRALEDLYDDARLDISDEDVKELQNYLDEWCKKCGVRDTFDCDKTHKIKIPWDKY